MIALHFQLQRADCGRIPDRPQQSGFNEGGQPRHPLVGILQLQQRDASRRDGPFGQSLDLNWQETAILAHDGIPAFTVERYAMRGADGLCLIHIRTRHRLSQIVDQEWLQAQEQQVA